MKWDRVVVTTFAGYFFTQILCLRSIKKYLPDLPIDIIIDDFELTHWPSYTQDCCNYIQQNFPDANITYHRYSDFAGMEKVKTGGWFRQQLIKLYLDHFVAGNNWLLVDADVVFKETPRCDVINATVQQGATPIDIGNRLYVSQMLDCDKPWLVDEKEFWCASSVPFRWISHSLLTALRNKIQSIHGKSLFDLHLELFDRNELVAFDPRSETMVMSEFQLIEVYRHRYSGCPLPIIKNGASSFEHSSLKDWQFDRAWFEQQGIPVNDRHWELSQLFGKHRA